MSKEITILGAGIAGLGAAYAIGKEKSVIYEQESYCGGLCGSFEIDGYIFDNAIHLSFSKNKQAREIFDKTNFITHRPNPINYYEKKWINHPIQNNLYFLEKSKKIEVVKSFLQKPKSLGDFRNYKEYLYCQYGEYIAENFMEKYTKKYWCTSSENLATDWLGVRMYDLTLYKLMKSVLMNKDNSEYYAQEMRYPIYGGFKSFLNPLVRETNVTFNKKIEKINLNKKMIEFSDGTNEYYEKLCSSIPLPEIISTIKDVPYDIRYVSEKLNSTSVILISIGFKNVININNLWVYVYDEKIPFSRIYFPHIKSKNNAPNGKSSVQCEVYYNKVNGKIMDNNNLAEVICNKLIDMGICTLSDIEFIDVREKVYANVIFDVDTQKNKLILKRYLKEQGIELIGRFGEWEYYWSDQSLLSGINKGNQLMKVNSGI